MELREVQRPLKQRYRAEPSSAVIRISASSSSGESPMACSVDIGRAVYEAQAHAGVGGPGTAACSGDLLLGSLAACAQVTCQMVAEAMGLPVTRVGVTVEGDLDLRGTLGISPEAPVGFESILVKFDIEGDGLTAEQLSSLQRKTERYCVVMQTLTGEVAVESDWPSGARSPE